jgi:hypothetical protein
MQDGWRSGGDRVVCRSAHRPARSAQGDRFVAQRLANLTMIRNSLWEVPLMAEPESDAPSAAPARRSDHSPWNWLLIIPIVVPLLTPLYNHDSPRLFGFPAFYWLQFAFIVLGVVTTTVVYRMTRRR